MKLTKQLVEMIREFYTNHTNIKLDISDEALHNQEYEYSKLIADVERNKLEIALIELSFEIQIRWRKILAIVAAYNAKDNYELQSLLNEYKQYLLNETMFKESLTSILKKYFKLKSLYDIRD